MVVKLVKAEITLIMLMVQFVIIWILDLELLVLPIQEANTLISANKEYELMGNDPVKVVDVIVGDYCLVIYDQFITIGDNVFLYS
jgi:hypothetical protein